MKEKMKLLEATNRFLQKERGYKRSWIRSFIAILIFSIIFGVVLGISYNLGPLSGSTAPSGVNYIRILAQASNANLLKVATYMSIAGICLMVFPFICGFATWMIGINQVTKSSYFHLFIWSSVAIAGILALIAMILLIRASIFNFTEFTDPSVQSQSATIMNLLF